MFRTFSLMLALVLCTSAWSTAHAAPPSIMLITEMLNGWKVKNLKLHRETPIKLGKMVEFDEIGLSHLAWPFGTACAAWQICRHVFWDNSDHKDRDADRDRAY